MNQGEWTDSMYLNVCVQGGVMVRDLAHTADLLIDRIQGRVGTRFLHVSAGLQQQVWRALAPAIFNDNIVIAQTLYAALKSAGRRRKKVRRG